MSWCQENSSLMPPARTSESNCWQINGHMVHWLPLAHYHRQCVYVCARAWVRVHANYHLSAPPSQHPSLSPLLLLALLSPQWCEYQAACRSSFYAWTPSCAVAVMFHNPRHLALTCSLPEAVWVCVCMTGNMKSQFTRRPFIFVQWPGSSFIIPIRLNGLIWKWNRTVMKVRDQTRVFC